MASKIARPLMPTMAIAFAIGPDGTAYTAWTRFDGDVWAVQASVRPPGEQFPGIADDIAGTGDSVVRELVTAADGRAIIGFDEIDSEGDELYWRAATAIYEPEPPPSPPPPSPPPAPTQVPAGPPAPPPGDTQAPKLKVSVSRKGFAPGDKLGQTAVERGKTSYVWKAVRKPLKEGTRLLVSLDVKHRLLDLTTISVGIFVWISPMASYGCSGSISTPGADSRSQAAVPVSMTTGRSSARSNWCSLTRMRQPSSPTRGVCRVPIGLRT